MNILLLIIQLVSGAFGGNLAGQAMKDYNLGPLGNSLAGIIGGGLGGQILTALSAGGLAAAGSGSLDLASIVSSIASGGVGGAVLMAIVGYIRKHLPVASH